jgi:hypothetical protein
MHKNFAWTSAQLPTGWKDQWTFKNTKDNTYGDIQWSTDGDVGTADETKSEYDKYKAICTDGLTQIGWTKRLEAGCTESYQSWIQTQIGFPLIIGGTTGFPFILGTLEGNMTVDEAVKFDEDSQIALEPVAVAADRRTRRGGGHVFYKLRKDEKYLNHLLKKR